MTAFPTETLYVDTSVLIALAKASLLDLLWGLWPGRIVIPTVVFDELKGRNMVLPFKSRAVKKVPKPFWRQTALAIEAAQDSSLLRIEELTGTEDAFVATQLASPMHLGEAAVYAMAYMRNGVCCSNDLHALRAKCEKNRVPLLGVFGILHCAFKAEVLTASEAHSAIARMRRHGENLPVTSFSQVCDWFENQEGTPLYDSD